MSNYQIKNVTKGRHLEWVAVCCRGGRMKIALATAAFAAVIMLIGSFEAGDAQAERDYYCAQIVLWNEDASKGIAPHDRRGWPHYDEAMSCK